MTAESELNIQDLTASIENAWREWIVKEEDRERSPHKYVYASAYRKCTRRMAYDLIQPEMQPAFDADILARFRRGKDRERDLLADLPFIGRNSDPSFEVIGHQERFEINDRRGRVIVVGKKDAEIKFAGGPSAPLECKSWSPTIISRISCFADLLNSPWTSSASYQILSYLYGFNRPYGIMLLDKPGIPLLLPVVLEDHLEQMERFLRQAEEAVDAAENNHLPEYIDDPSECRRCGYYGAICNPPMDSGPGAQVFTDQELEADLSRRDSLSEAADEYDAIDKRVKARLRGVEHGICGPFSITGSYRRKTSYDIPDEVKNKYKSTDEKGTFVLKIEKVA